MKVAQSLMAGAGRSDPPHASRRDDRTQGLPGQASLRDDARELQVPSDESLGYSQGPLRGETSPKRLVRLFT
jgi:hypothetical protein